jgi:intracellular septation protein
MSKAFITHSFIEFGPLTLFFFVSACWGFYPGATALVLSTLATLVYSIFHLKRLAYFSLTVSLFILLSGFATLYLHQPEWLVLEFTISNIFFGVALISAYRRHTLILKRLFKHMFSMTDQGWRILTLRWGAAFLIIGITNQIFWEIYPNENKWTLFRFIVTLLTIVFALSQFSLSRRERLPDASPWGLTK